MATSTLPSNSPSPDRELAAIERAAKAKLEVVAALAEAKQARKGRGDATDDLDDQIDIEQMALSRFTRAAEVRRRELRLFGGAK